MKSVVTYIRSLLGWSDDSHVDRLSFKRERYDNHVYNLGYGGKDGNKTYVIGVKTL